MDSARLETSTRRRTFVSSQLASLAGTLGVVFLAGRPQLVWLVFPALFVASYLWSKRQPAGLSRDQAKSLSKASALVFGCLATVSFSLGVLAFPEAFSFPLRVLPLLSVFIGVGVGFGSLVISLCALDTTGLNP